MSLQKLLLASHNLHKLEEYKAMFEGRFAIIGLTDIGWHEEIPEPFDTFEENAAEKCRTLFESKSIPCFAEDSGLMIDALHGQPGVFSARYAGPDKSSEANIQKVLQELNGMQDRRASYMAVIACLLPGEDMQWFKGSVSGKIAERKSGLHGFGYDPVFIPDGFHQSFGELPNTLKNAISHRKMAMDKFVDWLAGKF